MKRERNKQKQIWSDEEFIERLKKIKAQRLINGLPVKNIGQLTKEMLQCPSFKELEKELVNINKIKLEVKIKLDKQDLFR